MNILVTWFDSDQRIERAKLYRNIDPESVCMASGSIYFAHPGTWRSGMYLGRYSLRAGSWSWLSSDPKEIEEQMKNFVFPNNGDLGYAKEED